MEKVYVVTAVDFVKSTNGKARVLGAFRSEDAARNFVRNDMEETLDEFAGLRTMPDFELMQIILPDNDSGILWNVEATEIR